MLVADTIFPIFANFQTPIVAKPEAFSMISSYIGLRTLVPLLL